MAKKTVVTTQWIEKPLLEQVQDLRKRRDHWLNVATESGVDTETQDAALCKAEEAELEIARLI